jgi:FkbM family methyltransferase
MKMQGKILYAYLRFFETCGGLRIGGVYPLRILHYWLVTHFFKAPAATSGGKVFFLHFNDRVISSRILWRHSFEPQELEFMRTKIKKGDTAVDIGANIGYHTVFFSGWAGKRGRVFAFEPEPANCALLKRNSAANGCENIILEQKAVCEHPGNLRLFLREDQKGAHSLYASPDKTGAIEVECVTLDDYFYKRGIRVDFIKMDIEGAEGAVIRGGLKLFKETRNLKGFFEFNPFMLKAAGEEGLDFIKLLQDAGYAISRPEKETGQIREISLDDLREIFQCKSADEDFVTNLYFERVRG